MMVSVVSKKREEYRSRGEEMVSTELQTGPGIVVVLVAQVEVLKVLGG
jgi:hypothetical protein